MTREEICDTLIIRPVTVNVDGESRLKFQPEWEGPNPGCLRQYYDAGNAVREAREFILNHLYLPE